MAAPFGRGRDRGTTHDPPARYTTTEIAHRLGLSRASVESAIGQILEVSPRPRGVDGVVRGAGDLDLSRARVSPDLVSLIRVLASDD